MNFCKSADDPIGYLMEGNEVVGSIYHNPQTDEWWAASGVYPYPHLGARAFPTCEEALDALKTQWNSDRAVSRRAKEERERKLELIRDDLQNQPDGERWKRAIRLRGSRPKILGWLVDDVDCYRVKIGNNPDVVPNLKFGRDERSMEDALIWLLDNHRSRP